MNLYKVRYVSSSARPVYLNVAAPDYPRAVRVAAIYCNDGYTSTGGKRIDSIEEIAQIHVIDMVGLSRCQVVHHPTLEMDH